MVGWPMSRNVIWMFVEVESGNSHTDNFQIFGKEAKSGKPLPAKMDEFPGGLISDTPIFLQIFCL